MPSFTTSDWPHRIKKPTGSGGRSELHQDPAPKCGRRGRNWLPTVQYDTNYQKVRQRQIAGNMSNNDEYIHVYDLTEGFIPLLHAEPQKCHSNPMSQLRRFKRTGLLVSFNRCYLLYCNLSVRLSYDLLTAYCVST
jgi:hypothetical protein